VRSGGSVGIFVKSVETNSHRLGGQIRPGREYARPAAKPSQLPAFDRMNQPLAGMTRRVYAMPSTDQSGSWIGLAAQVPARQPERRRRCEPAL
jgi:hypothetical protein